jgi:hypothetical protein
MGLADRLRASFRQTEMLDLAFRDQVFDGSGDVLDRHVGIDAVLVEKIDHVCSKPLQRCLDGLADVGGPAVHVLAAIRAREFEAELGGDHDLVADRLQRFPDDVLVGERAIDLRPCRRRSRRGRAPPE